MNAHKKRTSKSSSHKSSQREIWVYADSRNGRLFSPCLKVLGKARELAKSFSSKVTAIFIGTPPGPATSDAPTKEAHKKARAMAEACISHGADKVLFLEHEDLSIPRSDVFSAVLTDAVKKQNPYIVLFALSEFTRELAARMARLCNAGLISECTDLRFHESTLLATSPAWSGQMMADITFRDLSTTGFATLQAHAFQPVKLRGKRGSIVRTKVNSVGMPEKIRLLSRSEEPQEKRKLEEADVVVAGGAGLGSAEGFELVRDLAAAVGGEVGATRPPVLQHWVEEERLIGQTGKTLRPELLFSIGTSGALQYTAGIMDAKRIIAVNTDRNAPIFQLADLGIVADARSFLPLLTEKLRAASMRKLADALYAQAEKKSGNETGPKIRKLRKTHGWSREALARATGQTPEYIEKVEKDEITPPVSFLLELARALKIDPRTFLREEQKTRIKNLRTQAFVKRTQNYSYQTLSPGAETDHLMAFMITIESKQAHKPVAYKHDGEEFIFVMEGDLKLTLGTKAHHLKPGDSIHFNANTPHKLKSISNEPTRCLVVLYTP